ncbi:hypothetical protein AeRB84_009416 [Aphanomyces euteiches]|nr:hypothetical protein AeRB84_009416 [Aphanomyces euteiches]
MDGEGHTHLHEGSLVSPFVLTSQLEVNSGHVKINDADMKLSNSKLSLHNDLTLDTPLIDVDMTSPTCIQGSLAVQELDTDWLHSLKIPPRSSALFVFDGQAWQTLTATEFDTTRLVNVKELSAAANLNIGEYQLTAHAIQVGGQPANRVALYGKGGLLTHDASLAYDATTSTLQVHQLQVDQVVGKIDMFMVAQPSGEDI